MSRTCQIGVMYWDVESTVLIMLEMIALDEFWQS